MDTDSSLSVNAAGATAPNMMQVPLMADMEALKPPEPTKRPRKNSMDMPAATVSDLQDIFLEEHEGGDGHGAPGFLEPGTNMAGIYTLCSISLGVGVFVLPAVIVDLGLVFGGILIVLAAFWSYWMQMALVDAAARCTPPATSYEEVAQTAFGSLGTSMVAFFSALTMLLGNAAHIKTVGGLLHDLMEWYITGAYGVVDFSVEKQVVLYVALLSVAIIFCAQKSIGSLRYISTASVLTVLITCTWCTGECLFWYWPKGQHSFPGSDTAVPMFNISLEKFFLNVPSVLFVFSGTFCQFPVCSELKDKSRENISHVIGWSNLVCAAGYLAVAVVGVLTFGTNITIDPFTHHSATNYLYVFPPDHYIVTLCSFLLVIVITLLYPVINFPLLNSVEKLIELGPASCSTRILHWQPRRLVISLLVMGAVMAINLQPGQGLVQLFGYCGAYGMGFVVYIIPGLLILKLDKEIPLWMQAATLLSIIFMMAIVVGFTYFSLR